MGEKIRVSNKTPESKGKKQFRNTYQPKSSQWSHSPVDNIMHLQRTAGNRAVEDLFNSGRVSRPTMLQAKLTVNQPDDIYEKEADRIAEQIMQMPGLTQLPANASPSTAQHPVEEKEDLPVQAKLSDEQPYREDVLTKARLHAGGCPGRPLPRSTRDYFEPRFGRDFGNVRVHTCCDAAQMNREINARAFTYGNNIYFNRDKYNPESASGKRLLAHELTHVVQQSPGSTGNNAPPRYNIPPPVTPLKKTQVSRLPIPTSLALNPLCIAQAIYAYDHARDSGKSDTWKHCYVSCKVATYCGDLTSAALGLLKEAMDLMGMGNAEFRDLVNDAAGIACSYSIWESCDSCCS